MNLADIWEGLADRMGDRVAQIHGEHETTFREFEDRAARLASALAAAGVKPGSKVAMYLYNASEYLETAFAALKLRAIPVNVNYRYLEDELHYLLENSDAEAVVYHGALADRIAAVRDRLPGLKLLVQVTTHEEDRRPVLAGARDYEAVLAESEPAPRMERSSDDLLFLYTGGTTGMPKGVMWKQSALLAQFAAGYQPLGEVALETAQDAVDAAEKLHEIGAMGPSLAAAPLMHGMAWFTSMSRLMTGGTVVILTNRSFDADELWAAISRHRVVSCTIVGDAFARPMVESLNAAAERGEPYDLSSLQALISAGVMFTAPYKQAFLDRGVAMVIDGLGSSEATGGGFMIATAGMDPTTARFQLGPNTKVFTEDGREVEPGSDEIGVLAVGGAAVADGYYKDEAKSDATFRVINGQRYSIAGDYARVEADGTVTLLGRGSVCINTGGEKVFPEEVEEVLKLEYAVVDCTVVGIPDEKWGQAITAVVELRDGASAKEAELIASARSKIAAYKSPKHVVFVDKIVRSPAGKADYRWALETAREQLGR